MEYQNITLSIPKRTLDKIKMIAVKRHNSISGMLTEILEEIVDQETGYARARRRQIDLMDRGLNLGLKGERIASRDELHER